MSIELNTGLAVERQKKIREILKQSGFISVEKLCNELSVSPATIRRDLAELDEKGMVRRVHGGAMAVDTNFDEPGFDDKTAKAAKQKQKIAELALSFVKSSSSIYIDGGSTLFAFAKLLGSHNRLTIVTNSLHVANLYAENGPRVILTGGEFRKISQTFVGSLTDHIINHVNFDIAFMGTSGLVGDELTTTDPAEAHTKEAVIGRAARVVLLVDSSKVGFASFAKFGTVNDVDVIVTDQGVSPEFVKEMKKKNVEVLY